MLHAKIILKSSPEGEGFSPISRMGHQHFLKGHENEKDNVSDINSFGAGFSR